MDKVVQPYDKECMKMAMLKHEETFKEQVYELHRLYETQKMLMKNMPRTRHNHQENISFNQNHHHHRVTETLNDEEIEDDECEIELTLAPTSFNRKRNMTNKPESSDSVPSFSSSSTGSSHMKRIERITRENSGFLNSNRRNLNNSSSDRSVKQSPWMYQVLSLNMT